MDMVEVLIITPCVGGVDLCVREREKRERQERERRKQCASATTHRLDLSQETGERGRNRERRERCTETV